MKHKKQYALLVAAVMSWIAMPVWAESTQGGGNNDQSVTTKDVVVEANRAKEEAKYESQSTTVITSEDIARKQGKSVEDVIFNEVGVTRTVDAMGKVGISIRGADPRHTLIMVDGQPVLGDVSKYQGNGDELMRIGAENIDHIEIVRGAASAKYGADAIGGVVNVITKAPKDKAGVQLNAEGQYHKSRYDSSYESSALPSNWYFRADSGKIGKLKVAGWMSKRDILPVYAKDHTENMFITTGVIGPVTNWKKGINWWDNFKPSLRYYGSEDNTGLSGSYEFNENNKIDFRITHDAEDMKRLNKSVYTNAWNASFAEPMRDYRRTMKRDHYDITYTGKNGKSDWNLNVNYGKMREDDSTVLTRQGAGYDQYSGYNTLATVDWLEHYRTNVNLNMNTAVNDKHYLSYGVGYTKEHAEGSRLKNAPRTHTMTIDPWDYDKSLYVPDNTAGKDDKPASNVHNYNLKKTENGYIWDKNSEYYGGTKPPITYDEFVNWRNDPNKITYAYFDEFPIQANAYNLWKSGKYEERLQAALQIGTITKAEYDKYVNIGNTIGKSYDAFDKILKTQNNMDDLVKQGIISVFDQDRPVEVYFLGPLSISSSPDAQKYIKYNGVYYGQGFAERENQILIGEADLKKTYAYVADTWQVNDNTLFMPSLRLDHSDLFGSKVTGNLGLTYNVGGNAHRRLKANIGTGYAEPGLGELYYNWEMFGGTGADHLGWYWIGNEHLKPEKSLNFDISLEGENNKTYTKVALFHNEIKDYMTMYFTGQLIDFNFNGADTIAVPDRIYSFKNLGKAKITGLEAEVQQKFNDHWSAKLGYTWLHAVNASDPDMPDRLLDKPTHKFDISLNYRNDKSGFRGAFWGSYYKNMLDSNSVSTDSLFGKDENGNYIRKQGDYKNKSFGVWNLLLEKDFGKDMTAYVGVDNIFNHQDDDRALQDRVYRFGVNIKVADLGDVFTAPTHTVKDADGNPIPALTYGSDWFLTRPDAATNGKKAGDVELIGDYRLRSNIFGGQHKPGMRATKETQADSEAGKNFADEPGHGLEQRLRLGVDYQIANGLNLKVLGSTAKRDTSYNVAEKRGLHDPYLEQAELTKSTSKWDWSVGRISEPMGVTGYWFGKEYDGVRVKYTDSKTQVTAGYGDFSQTTGVTDSAYNHKEWSIIHRAPTLNELLGLYSFAYADGRVVPGKTIEGQIYKETYDPDAKYNYFEKFNAAGCVKNQKTGEWEPDPKLTNVQVAEAKLAVVREFIGVLKGVDSELKAMGKIKPTDWSQMDKPGVDDNNDNNLDYQLYSSSMGINKFFSNFKTVDITIKTDQGDTIDFTNFGRPGVLSVLQYGLGNDEVSKTYGGLEGMLDSKNIKAYMGKVLDKANDYYNNGKENTYLDHSGKVISRDAAINQMLSSFVGIHGAYTGEIYGVAQVNRHMGDAADYNAVSKIFQGFTSSSWGYDPVQRAPIPLPGAPIAFAQQGYLLKQDKIPAMDRAAFVKVRQQLSDNVGIEAWKLNSFGEGAYDALGQKMKIADVIGIGTKVRLGDRSMFSFDYGQNRSAMGKYFHGGMGLYGEKSGGSTPDFFVARLDMGIADTDVPGSWNAYLDYKSFDHGAFLGGTGADLPDRYLDGIRSFTAGLGYVPARNFLLEASYTFDAHSTQKRDTLYTPENFSLGDYTRVSLTYKF